MAHEEPFWLKVEPQLAGWLSVQMELLLAEYADKGEKELHPADKAEAYRVASMAASMLVTINETLDARGGGKR